MTADARPQNMSGAVKWIYSTGASSLAPPSIRPGVAHYAASNDQLFHAVTATETGGMWPSGWTPPGMNGPAQG